MFMRFFSELRQARVPVTLKEYLALMEALDKQVIDRSVDDFYYLSRAVLVKDEKNLDKFDRVFGHVFKGLETVEEGITADIPAEWLKALTEKFLTEEEKAQIEAMGGFDKLMEMLQERLREQKAPERDIAAAERKLEDHEREIERAAAAMEKASETFASKVEAWSAAHAARMEAWANGAEMQRWERDMEKWGEELGREIGDEIRREFENAAPER